jgi:hypothetical protein
MTTPNCLELLTWLDGFVDQFNSRGKSLRRPDRFTARYAEYSKPYKYECEDLDEAVESFFGFCRDLELKPAQADAYLDVFVNAAESQRAGATDPRLAENLMRYRDAAIKAVLAHPEAPLAAVRGVARYQLWLRAALAVDPWLAAPLPVWPLALKRDLDQADANFSGGSENWTHSNHDDATWAKRTLLQDMKKRGWFDPEQAEEAADTETNARIEKARLEYLASIGITIQKIEGPSD